MSLKIVQSWQCCRHSHATVLAASSTISDRPQRMPEGHTWPVDRTAERIDYLWRYVDAILTPCPRPERSEPLDTDADLWAHVPYYWLTLCTLNIDLFTYLLTYLLTLFLWTVWEGDDRDAGSTCSGWSRWQAVSRTLCRNVSFLFFYSILLFMYLCFEFACVCA